MISLKVKQKNEFINLIIKKDSDMDLFILYLLQLIHETNVKARFDSKIETLMKKKHSEQLCHKKRIKL